MAYFLFFQKILKNAEKFEYFIPQKIPQPIFQTLCRTKKFRKVSFPLNINKKSCYAKYLRKENDCYEFYTLQSK